MNDFLPELPEDEGYLPQKEWRAFLDELYTTGRIKGDPGIMEKMNGQQQWCVNEVKKTIKRNK